MSAIISVHYLSTFISATFRNAYFSTLTDSLQNLQDPKEMKKAGLLSESIYVHEVQRHAAKS